MRGFSTWIPKIFLLIVYKNITKNNNLLNLAIQNKNIKTNISRPLQRKKYNPNFSFFLKEIKELSWVLTWKYLKQGFWEKIYIYIRGLQCSKWSTSCILFRSCCNILHPSIKYVIHYSKIYQCTHPNPEKAVTPKYSC
jgi:hypothetical protein